MANGFGSGFGSGFAGGPRKRVVSTGFGDLPRIDNLSLRQERSMRSAVTEVDRTRKLLQAIGQENLLDKELEPEQSMLSTVFDYLGRPQRAVLGGIYELSRGTGDVSEAFSEAARQFTQSEDRKYKDLRSGSQLFTASPSSEATWGEAIAGFALDIAMDPLTYVPIVGWGGKAATKIGGVAAPAIARAAMKPGTLGDLAKQGIRTKDAVGTMFSPEYKLRQQVYRPHLGDASGQVDPGKMKFGDLTTFRSREGGPINFIGSKVLDDEKLDIYTGTKLGDQASRSVLEAELREKLAKVVDGLTESEAKLLTIHAEKGFKELDGLLQKGYKDLDLPGIATAERRKLVIQKGKDVLNYLRNTLGEEEYKLGLLDFAQLRTTYVPIRTVQGKKIPSAALRDAGIAAKATRKRQPFQRLRKYEHVQDAINAGVPNLELDIRKLAATRTYESIKARTTRNLRKSVFESGVAIPLNEVGIQAGLKGEKVTEDLLKSIKRYKQTGVADDVVQSALDKGYDFAEIVKNDGTWHALPKAIVDDLDSAQKFFSNNESFNNLVESFQRWQGLWKGGALFSLGYHMRNMWSNGFNNAVGGITDPRLYKQALDLQVANGQMSRRFLSGSEREAVKTATQADLDLFRRLRGYNVVGRGQIGVEIGTSATGRPTGSIPGIPGRVLGSRPMRANRQLGEAIEDNARIAHFIGTKKKIWTKEKGLLGVDKIPEKHQRRIAAYKRQVDVGDMSDEELYAELQAAASVKKYLFDYEDLTPFERDVMKSVIPFYTWMRKNIPLQIESMLTKEMFGKKGLWYMAIPKIKNNLEQMSADFEEVHTPDYFEDMYATRLPVKTEGKAMYFNPNLPFQDLNRMSFKDVMSSLSPAFRLPYELGAGTRGWSYFFDRPIDTVAGDPDPLTGLPRKARYATEALLPPVSRFITRPIEKIQRGQGFDLALSDLAGLKTHTLDVEGRKRARIYAEREAARTAKAKLRQQLGER
jgi:hypothetical protein